MNEERKLEVLRAIVEDYVRTREPVGSRAIADRHQLAVSSATIRNDMAALEEEGLISAPHTSAGRIPTDKGYRLFVDRVSEVKPLSGPERRAITALLQGEGNMEDVLDRTVRALAQLTNQVAVVQYPSSSRAKVTHVELVPMGRHQVLIVLILDTGKVEQGVYDVGQQLSEPSLAALRASFLKLVAGSPVSQLPLLVEAVVAATPFADLAAAQSLANGLCSLARAAREERFLVSGTANLARSDVDFPLSIGPVLDALEEHMVMLRLLSELAQDATGVAVSIGRENSLESLSGASVVASSYGPGDCAKLGILGPIRMDYSNAMSAVRAVARYLTRILAG